MAIDLKPLSEETIEQMGHAPRELWVIKIETELYGPFETESLKHYAFENKQEFVGAEVTHLEFADWKPFSQVEELQKAQQPVQALPETAPSQDGPYWIFVKEQKSAPMALHELDLKVEMGVVAMTDLVSTDDGHTWKQILELPVFEKRKHQGSELPFPPPERSFQEAKIEVSQNLEAQESLHEDEGLFALAYLTLNKDKPTLNIEEITLKTVQETQVSRSLKWAVPTAVASGFALVMTGYFLFSSPATVEVAEESTTAQVQRGISAGNDLPPPTYSDVARNPASLMPMPSNRSPLTRPMVHESYPTHLETHVNEADPIQDPIHDIENQDQAPPQEHSLVSEGVPNEQPAPAEDPGQNPPELTPQPAVEESSDF